MNLQKTILTASIFLFTMMVPQAFSQSEQMLREFKAFDAKNTAIAQNFRKRSLALRAEVTKAGRDQEKLKELQAAAFKLDKEVDEYLHKAQSLVDEDFNLNLGLIEKCELGRVIVVDPETNEVILCRTFESFFKEGRIENVEVEILERDEGNEFLLKPADIPEGKEVLPFLAKVKPNSKQYDILVDAAKNNDLLNVSGVCSRVDWEYDVESVTFVPVPILVLPFGALPATLALETVFIMPAGCTKNIQIKKIEVIL